MYGLDLSDAPQFAMVIIICWLIIALEDRRALQGKQRDDTYLAIIDALLTVIENLHSPPDSDSMTIRQMKKVREYLKGEE